jgi:hypothetical protein
MTVYPIFEIRNLDDVLVDTVDYESIYAGHQTATQHLKFINHTASQLDVTLTPKSSLTPLGTAIDTYKSQYLSLDDETYSTVLLLEIPAYDSLDCYLKYQPPSTGKVGEKAWEVSQRDESLSGADLLPSWFYALNINIRGNATETTNARALVTIPYVDGKMQSDFRDLRFMLADGTELEYEEAYLIDGVECTFIITIPTLPASPGSVDVYAYSGNGLAISEATDASVEEYNWYDNTLPPWTQELGSRSAIETSTMFHDPATYYYHLDAWYASYQGVVSIPSTTTHGVWQFSFKWKALSQSVQYVAIIRNGTSAFSSPRYEIAWDNNASFGNGIISLKYNGTTLNSVQVDVDTNIHTITVIRDSANKFSVYLDDTFLFEQTNSSLSTSTNLSLRYHAVASNPENQQIIYYDYVNIIPADVTGTITIGTWTFYAVLNCKAGILYKSQDLPELEAEISYGCRIGGDYYE